MRTRSPTTSSCFVSSPDMPGISLQAALAASGGRAQPAIQPPRFRYHRRRATQEDRRRTEGGMSSRQTPPARRPYTFQLDTALVERARREVGESDVIRSIEAALAAA